MPRYHPLTLELTALVALEYDQDLRTGNRVSYCADYSYHDEMFSQSIDNEFNRIGSRELVNFIAGDDNFEGDWTLRLYGDNVSNEGYEVGRLDLGFSGFTEIMRSNDRSEFGLRFTKRVRRSAPRTLAGEVSGAVAKTQIKTEMLT